MESVVAAAPCKTSVTCIQTYIHTNSMLKTYIKIRHSLDCRCLHHNPVDIRFHVGSSMHFVEKNFISLQSLVEGQ